LNTQTAAHGNFGADVSDDERIVVGKDLVENTTVNHRRPAPRISAAAAFDLTPVTMPTVRAPVAGTAKNPRPRASPVRASDPRDYRARRPRFISHSRKKSTANSVSDEYV